MGISASRPRQLRLGTPVAALGAVFALVATGSPPAGADFVVGVDAAADLARGSAVWDGTHAYLFGGATWGPLDFILQFDPAKASYDPQGESLALMNARLPSARTDTAAVWDGAFAYILGGDRDGHQILRYDTTADEIALLDTPLPSARRGASAVWTGEAAYVFGGFRTTSPAGYLDEIVRFDPATGTIGVVSARLPTGRAYTSAAWDGTFAYIFGGEEGFRADQRLNEIVRFDPSSDIVTVVDATLPAPQRLSGAVWADDRAVVFGGIGTWRDVVLFEPRGGQAHRSGAALPVDSLGPVAVWADTKAFVLAPNQVVAYDLRPAPPANVVAEPGAGLAEITVRWMDLHGDDVDTYRIYRGSTPLHEELLADVGADVRSFTDSWAPDVSWTHDGNYYYVVTAVNRFGESQASHEIACAPWKALVPAVGACQ